ncbi:mucin-3A [Aplysia californica]|uniref:Mucin-3A n=1 Tax=Aplysia californica TaxID=6500 RepID=A0ABM0ZWD2_APLCA|nr:mucin-3A [Aplysia californica]
MSGPKEILPSSVLNEPSSMTMSAVTSERPDILSMMDLAGHLIEITALNEEIETASDIPAPSATLASEKSEVLSMNSSFPEAEEVQTSSFATQQSTFSRSEIASQEMLSVVYDFGLGLTEPVPLSSNMDVHRNSSGVMSSAKSLENLCTPTSSTPSTQDQEHDVYPPSTFSNPREATISTSAGDSFKEESVQSYIGNQVNASDYLKNYTFSHNDHEYSLSQQDSSFTNLVSSCTDPIIHAFITGANDNTSVGDFPKTPRVFSASSTHHSNPAPAQTDVSFDLDHIQPSFPSFEQSASTPDILLPHVDGTVLDTGSMASQNICLSSSAAPEANYTAPITSTLPMLDSASDDRFHFASFSEKEFDPTTNQSYVDITDAFIDSATTMADTCPVSQPKTSNSFSQNSYQEPTMQPAIGAYRGTLDLVISTTSDLPQGAIELISSSSTSQETPNFISPESSSYNYFSLAQSILNCTNIVNCQPSTLGESHTEQPTFSDSTPTVTWDLDTDFVTGNDGEEIENNFVEENEVAGTVGNLDILYDTPMDALQNRFIHELSLSEQNMKEPPSCTANNLSPYSFANVSTKHRRDVSNSEHSRNAHYGTDFQTNLQKLQVVEVGSKVSTTCLKRPASLSTLQTNHSPVQRQMSTPHEHWSAENLKGGVDSWSLFSETLATGTHSETEKSAETVSSVISTTPSACSLTSSISKQLVSAGASLFSVASTIRPKPPLEFSSDAILSPSDVLKLLPGATEKLGKKQPLTTPLSTPSQSPSQITRGLSESSNVSFADSDISSTFSVASSSVTEGEGAGEESSSRYVSVKASLRSKLMTSTTPMDKAMTSPQSIQGKEAAVSGTSSSRRTTHPSRPSTSAENDSESVPFGAFTDSDEEEEDEEEEEELKYEEEEEEPRVKKKKTEEETEETRLAKREKNRLAAQKCRHRQRTKIETLSKQVTRLEDKQSRVKTEVERLREEREVLEEMLRAHDCVCQNKDKLGARKGKGVGEKRKL